MDVRIRDVILELRKVRQNSLILLFENINSQFTTSPASTKYHGNFFGGLINHTMNVINISRNLYRIAGDKQNFTLESLLFCALVHDIGKIGSHDDNMYVLEVDDDKQSYIYNDKLVPNMPHEWWSVYYLNLYMVPVSPDELFAILNHAGPYNPGNRYESPLQIMLHSADNISAKVDNL